MKLYELTKMYSDLFNQFDAINAKHGTSYSYGQFVAQIAAGKIKPLGFYDYAD